ncbi:MAG TPA: protein kinase [Rhodothermales bacterium]|nr:protein kinase [Rhodothermales bacterium]
MKMDAKSWSRVKELVQAAIELDPSARRAFVVEACKDDAEVRREVLSLLEQDLRTTYIGEGNTPFSLGLPPAPELRIGTYEILGVIGRGGMGTVYRARDVRLNRLVALKTLLPHLAADSEPRKRFVQEARAASKLEHPNICAVFEIGETETGALFIATSLVVGDSLREIILARKLKLGEVIDITLQVLSGLAAAHALGIVHRDLKPSNIMVDRDGVAKIVDFGVAKIEGDLDLTQTGSTVGTISYMSPEGIRGHPMDQRADIWSMGVILYELLSGRRPFEAEYRDAVAYRIINETPTPLKEIDPSIPRYLASAAEKCLAKDPRERFADVSELIACLQRVAGDPKTEKERFNVKRLREEGVRRPVLIAAAALLVVLALTIVLLVRSDRHAKGLVELQGSEFTEATEVAVAPFWHLDRSETRTDSIVQMLIVKEMRHFEDEYPGLLEVETMLEPIDAPRTSASGVKTSTDALIVWGEVVSSGDEGAIVSRITVPHRLDLLRDSPLMPVGGAVFVPRWSDVEMTFPDAEGLQGRIHAARRTATIAAMVAATQPRILQSYPSENVLRLLRRDSTSAEAAEFVARVLLQNGRASEARSYLGRSIQSYPSRSSLRLLHAAALILLGDTTGGLKSTQEAVRLEPADMKAHLRLAAIQHWLGNEQSATSEFETALDVAPMALIPIVRSAIIERYIALGEYRLAERHLADAIEIGEAKPEQYESLAQLYAMQGRDDDAEFVLRELIARDSAYPERYLALARHYLRLGNTDGALAIATVENMGAANAFNWKARVYEQRGGYTKAVSYLERRLDVFEDSWTIGRLGRLQMKLGRYTDAEASLEMAVSDPNTEDLFEPDLARTHVLLGKPEEALRVTRLWRMENPNVGRGTMALIHFALGNYEQAVSYQSPPDGSPPDAETHLKLAIQLASAGQYEAAFKHYEESLALQPSMAKAHLLYCLSLIRTGHREEAYDRLASFIGARETLLPESTDPFAREIAMFYLGQRTEDDLLRPESQSERDSLSKGVSGSYSVGMGYLLDFGRNLAYPAPDTLRATQLFRRALNYGDHPYRLLAMDELRRLGAGRFASSTEE